MQNTLNPRSEYRRGFVDGLFTATLSIFLLVLGSFIALVVLS